MAYTGSGIKDASPMEQLVMWLRDDLSGEIDAINQYQWHIDNIDDPEIKEILSHIRDEEKEHLAELMKLIARIDEIQREKFLEENDVFEGSGGNEVGESIAGVKSSGGTVGSLKK